MVTLWSQKLGVLYVCCRYLGGVKVNISGASIKAGSRSKNVLANEIGQHLGLPESQQRKGSTIDQSFMAQVLTSLGGSPLGLGKYELTESVFELLGLSYDPTWDTSEAQEHGGGTITARAYSRILAELTSRPRCFILNVADSEIGNSWETNHESEYRFDSSVSGRKAILDAGPGSYVLFYSTSNSRVNPKSFSGLALVSYVSGSYRTDAWVLNFSNYVALPTPVKSSEISVAGWNKQNAITEIPIELLRDICAAGSHRFDQWASEDKNLVETKVDRELTKELSGFVTPSGFSIPPRNGPQGESDKRLMFTQERTPRYEESDDRSLVSVNGSLEQRPTYAATNRQVELRAIEVATRCLQEDRWILVRDRQKDGCGYDLEFRRSDETIYVEVKGIKSSTVAFNITPKERWRIETDPHFVLIAVSKALTSAPKVSVFTPQQLALLPIQAVGYRVDATGH